MNRSPSKEGHGSAQKKNAHIKKAYNKKTGPRKRFGIKPVSLAVLLLALGVVGTSLWNLWQLQRQVEGRLSYLRTEKAALVQKQEQLQQEIRWLNDPAYVEQLARTQLGLVRRGEIPISPKK
ncbi:Septum formation initiator [Acididesulfobacillus acetoxydans]|uniref:Septum formation initiator n=1 Tax=Acididesulfobacillus acetoxydans TaxID=1561005 RepID=A0A8S0Y1S7_9FIRM|nr:septum formation initiator family protein [Acididesulfobacillus acetoxydans]CAA7599905.1 Septum formation initiator [Acididesulfobacillus acetoxydans]CEJ08951.1 Septum formation initiator [Acididesulfobacillus acetoxydans]